MTEHIPNIEIDVFFDGLLTQSMLTGTVSKRLLGGLEQLLILNMKFQMAQMNITYTGGTETVFLMTDPRYSFSSSSLIKVVSYMVAM